MKRLTSVDIDLNGLPTRDGLTCCHLGNAVDIARNPPITQQDPRSVMAGGWVKARATVIGGRHQMV
jgi:hypothetical protein